MTVETTNITSGPYTGNGLSDEYDYDFRVDNKNQLIVYETDDDGVQTTLTVDTDYTVGGVGVDEGGTITRVAGNLPTGYKWYIRSNYQATQETDFASQGGFFPRIHARAFDKLTFLTQQLTDRISRSLRFSDSYSGSASSDITEPVAGAYLRWNDAGDALINDPDIVSVIGIGGAITAVAGLSAEITALGLLSAEITALGLLTSEIAGLGALTAEITALGAIVADITTAAANSADISTVADNIATILQAVDAVGYAAEWAINPEDVPVSIAAGGDGSTTFSALHWAAKAAGNPSFASLSDVNFTTLADAQIPSYDSGTGKWVNIDLPAPPGQGGTSITGDVTLTASSPGAMTVTPTLYGRYATLPDATTCEKGAVLFSFYNDSDIDYGVKDAAGNKLGWVKAYESAIIGLSDNSTSSGDWTYYGLMGFATTAKSPSLLSGVVCVNFFRRVEVDSDRLLFLFGGTSCYAVVYNTSTKVWGSPSLVKSSIASGGFTGVMCGVDIALIVLQLGTSTNAVCLSLSGTSIVVETATLASAANSGTFKTTTAKDVLLIPVGSSFVTSYSDEDAARIRAFTVTGVTPSIGAEATLSGSAVQVSPIFAEGSVVRTVTILSTSIYIYPYLVSGTTLTLGTGAYISDTVYNSVSVKKGLNGNLIIASAYSAETRVSIIKLTGTTEVSTSLSMVPGLIASKTAFFDMGGGSTLFVYTSGVTMYATMITDTAGTPTKGSITNAPAVGSPIGIQTYLSSSNVVTVVLGDAGPAGYQQALDFDVSGAAPVMLATNYFTRRTGTFPIMVAPTKTGYKNSGSIQTRKSFLIFHGDADTSVNLLSISGKQASLIPYPSATGFSGVDTTPIDIRAGWVAAYNASVYTDYQIILREGATI